VLSAEGVEVRGEGGGGGKQAHYYNQKNAHARF
jgi:hypothetical protein